MTISAMAKNAMSDKRAQEEIKTTAGFAAAWVVGCVIGIVGGLVIFG